MERLRPLAQRLRVECGSLDVVVVEALCISEGRYWSYCCDNAACCSPEGAPMGLPGTSVLAAAATYAGIQVRGTLRELRARLLPWENAAALEQEAALDTASMALVPKLLDDVGRAAVTDETLDLAGRIMDRFADAQPVSGTLLADLRDDELLECDEAARLILGLQDRATRDRAAEWMEGDEAARALRLWRTLARRCVGPYGEHAAAPLTLAGWVAWSTGDELEAREALAMALGADPDYLFARLLHQACNEGLDPESIRSCLRAERKGRGRTVAELLNAPADADDPTGRGTTAAPDPGPAAQPPRAAITTDPEPRDKSARAAGPTGFDPSPTGFDPCDGLSSGAVTTESGPSGEPASAAVPSHRRRRFRSTGTTGTTGPAGITGPAGTTGIAGAASGRTGAKDRDLAARTPRRRTPADPTRPAGDTGTGARPGRPTPADAARPGSVRTGRARARVAKKAAMPRGGTDQESKRPGHGTGGEE
jgi:hypothetical protein